MLKLNEKYFPKVYILIFATITTFLFFAFAFPILSGLCSEYEGNCLDSYRNYALTIFWAPFLLWISICFYFQKTEIYNRWVKFAVPWIILSYLGIFFTVEYGSFVQGTIMLLVTAVLICVSLGIILLNIIKPRQKIEGVSNEAFSNAFVIILGALSLLLLSSLI